MAHEQPVASAHELRLPVGSGLDPRAVFAVATRTNAAQAALGTQLMGVEARGATIRTPWHPVLSLEGTRWPNLVVATLIDHACSLAALMALDDPARWGGSLDLRIDYRRPLDASPFLYAHAVCDEPVGAVVRVTATVSTQRDHGDPGAIGSCSIAVTPS